MKSQFDAVIKFAEQYVVENKYPVVDTRHYLLALTGVDSKARVWLENYGINKDVVKIAGAGEGFGTLVEDPEIAVLKTNMEKVRVACCDDHLEPIHVLMAFFNDTSCKAYKTMKSVIGSVKLNQMFKSIMQQNATLQANIRRINEEDLPECDDVIPNSVAMNNKSNAYVDKKSISAVSSPDIPFCTDITQKAEQNELDPVIGRSLEIERIIQVLSRRNKNNPVLVGQPGVGKSAVVEGLAQKIVDGEVPDVLLGKRIFQLDIAGMVAGTRYRGDFEERLKKTIDVVCANPYVILFIDEIHNLVGAGGNADGSMNAAEIMKPVLARGVLRTVGATTLDEYDKYIEKDPALSRRFQRVLVEEPSQGDTVAILHGVKAKYELHHGVVISDEAIRSAVELSVRYVSDRFLPDKAFDLIDEACSMVRISRAPKNPQLVLAQRNRENLRKQVVDYEKNGNDMKRLAELNNMYKNAVADCKRLAEQNKEVVVVTSEDVAKVVSDWTKIPVTQITQSEKERLLGLEKLLGDRIIGQKQAVGVVASAIRRQRAGLKDPNRPIGSFIFVGPTGVGKTELTKALAECLFGSESEIVRLDMSEYMEKQSVSKLIGAPPGYAGFEENGFLTERVRRKPYSVVLFDEIEKAHPEVFDVMLQILDDGILTDSHGKTVDFKNTVIIMTSNIGSDIGSRKIGFGEVTYETLQKSAVDALRKHFRPEFLNRIDEVVVFDRLNKDELLKIAELMCKSLVKRLADTITLRFTYDAVQFLCTEGYTEEYGARPLRRTIQRQVENVLAEKLISGEIKRGEKVTVGVSNGRLTFSIG